MYSTTCEQLAIGRSGFGLT